MPIDDSMRDGLVHTLFASWLNGNRAWVVDELMEYDDVALIVKLHIKMLEHSQDDYLALLHLVSEEHIRRAT